MNRLIRFEIPLSGLLLAIIFLRSIAVVAHAEAIPVAVNDSWNSQVIAAPSPSVPNGIILVNTLLDENDGSCSDDDCSLRDAIQVANPGDTINFSVTGTIILNSGRLLINKDLTINGPGRDNLTIDGNDNGQVFYVFASYHVNISGLTITNGINMYGYGGGMYNSGYLTMTDVSFYRNNSINPQSGSGLYNEGVATLANVTFSENYNDGLYNKVISTLTDVIFSENASHGINNYGNVSLTNVSFINNSGVSGAGLYNHTSSISTLTNVTFNGNSASSYGGGMYNDDHLTSTLTNLTFTGNSASVGGGLYTRSEISLTNITFSNNSADTGGGMTIVMGIDHTLILTNVTFSGNKATNYGGGLSVSNGTAKLTNVTFSGNSANSGGGIYVWETWGTLKMKDSILSSNSAPNGPNCGGILTSYGYNLIQDATGCTITGNEIGNVYGEDPLLGPLGNYGGYTPTHALLAGSPAIDAADSTNVDGNPVTLDQRGIPRPQGPANDIGAFEYVNKVFFWLPVILK